MRKTYRLVMDRISIKRALAVLSISAILLSCGVKRVVSQIEQERRLTIVAVNDMHAALDQFPRFAFMVDSLRRIYPDLLLVSAGDNQTGNPVNDQYPTKGLPMIMLMNALGFDMSAVGNHEFDTSQKGFAKLVKAAKFPFLAANVHPADSLGIFIKPYEKLTMKNGLRLIFASVLDINPASGIPDSHPRNVRGFTFENHLEAAPKYIDLRQSCDLLIFLNHTGFENDKKIAQNQKNGELPLIIGGHSHTKIDSEEFFNGTLITQAESKLKYLSLIQISVDRDGGVKPQMKLLPIDKKGSIDRDIQRMVDDFRRNNSALAEVVASSEVGLTSVEQLGCFMADMIQEAEGVDFSFINKGGVRIDNIAKGEVTANDIYTLDPFGNELMRFTLTGEEIVDLFVHAFTDDKNRLLYPSSNMKAIYTLKDENTILGVQLFLRDGTPLDLAKNYTVVLNNYIASSFKFKRNDQGTGLFRTSAETIIEHLRRHSTIKPYDKEKRIEIRYDK